MLQFKRGKSYHSGLEINFPESWICYVNMYQYHNAILRNNNSRIGLILTLLLRKTKCVS
jgi:hypothetical protein